MMKVAVIGCGHWGKNLLRNFFELGALNSISDPSEDLCRKFSAEYNVPALDYSEVLESDCDGVVISAPARLHASLAQEAFAAGKHVYVEKPLAMTLEEADAIIDAGRKANRHLMVGHLLQYHPIFARLRDLVKQGALGEMQYMYSNRFSLGKIRAEEDVLWSFAPHDISMILSLTDRLVKSVRCEASDILQKNICDVARVRIEFEDGLTGHISCSWLHPYKEQKLVLVGNKGMAVFDDTLEWSQKLALFEHKVDMNTLPPEPQKSDVRYVEVPEAEPLKIECQYFLDLMNGKARPLTDGFEGRAVLEVLTEASASIASGKTLHA